MDILLSIPILVIVSVLQMAVFSRLSVMHGSADLLLLVLASWGLHEKAKKIYIWAIIAGLLISFVSAQPFPLPLVTYLFIAWLTRLMHGRIWQSPILAVLIITIIGTLIQHLTLIGYSQFTTTPLPFQLSLQQVTLPSIFLNLIAVLPVYVIVRDLEKSVYRDELYE